MTAKEKAKELVDKMYLIDDPKGNYLMSFNAAKQCALLAVDDGPDRWFHTSEVQKQEECEGYDLLHTLNSIYKVTPNFTSIPGVQEKHSLTIE
jgi:hypothetical protein